ncbi:MAG: family 16 glycoside hydrolase [Candidatus Hydrogenedentota bacterium]
MRIFVTTLLMCSVAVGATAVELMDDPVAVLESDTTFKVKAQACRTLQREGTPDAVPVLKELLTDAKLAHMARLALETMPYDTVDAALRDALAETEGELQVGIINSIGHRGDEKAVPALADLLSAANPPAVSQAAGRALGRIANAEAVEALDTLMIRSDLKPENFTTFNEARLTAAETLAARGEKEQAAAMWQRLLENKESAPTIRAAALRGLALAEGGEEGLSVLLEGIRAQEEALFLAALRTAREIGGGDAVDKALAQELPNLSDTRKIQLMQTLAERGGHAAGPAMLELAKAGATNVRIAAINALTRAGYEPLLELVSDLVWAEDDKIAAAAKDALSYFPADAGDAVLRDMRASEDAKTRKLAVTLIGKGGLADAGDLLMGVSEDDASAEVRVAALQAMRNYATLDQLDGLIEHVLAARSDKELSAAQAALAALCSRLQRTPAEDIVIEKAVYGAEDGEEQKDVTQKVAALVEAGKRSIEASNSLLGDAAPGTRKQLRIEYTVNGTPASKTVAEGETVAITDAAVPAGVVDAFLAAYEKAEGDAKRAMMRLLGATGSPVALAKVQKVAESGEDALKDAALRELCDWPTLDAFDPVMELALNAQDDTVKVLALRGAVRLLRESGFPNKKLLAHYEKLMGSADTPDTKRLVLSGLADMSGAPAFEMALTYVREEGVRAEAVQTATAVAKRLGQRPREDRDFFNGKDLTGWSGPEQYWSVVDGAIVGSSDTEIPKNTFIWADREVRDFYLVLDVKLEPNSANAGIQFRSEKIDDYGQARGYQADMGADVWGRLYYEQGRGKLFWDGRAEEAVKPGEWNRYEILAVGPAIWTAINDTLGVAFLDDPERAEREGLIAFQIHGGPPQTASYKIHKLVHNPKVELEDTDTGKLVRALEPAE